MKGSHDTTELLRAWTRGEKPAGEELFDRLYDEIRRLAHRRRRSRGPEPGIETTALVHEVYLRLVDQRRADWQCRAQFFAVAARVMRRVLVDEARAKGAEKRGGDADLVPLAQLGDIPFGDRPDELLKLDACLSDLEQLDPRQARLVELRFFAGLSLEATAEALGQSRATTVRQWRLTKAWLHRQLSAS